MNRNQYLNNNWRAEEEPEEEEKEDEMITHALQLLKTRITVIMITDYNSLRQPYYPSRIVSTLHLLGIIHWIYNFF